MINRHPSYKGYDEIPAGASNKCHWFLLPARSSASTFQISPAFTSGSEKFKLYARLPMPRAPSLFLKRPKFLARCEIYCLILPTVLIILHISCLGRQRGLSHHETRMHVLATVDPVAQLFNRRTAEKSHHGQPGSLPQWDYSVANGAMGLSRHKVFARDVLRIEICGHKCGFIWCRVGFPASLFYSYSSSVLSSELMANVVL